MPLLDLSLVTDTLRDLIKKRVEAGLALIVSSPPPVTVSPLAPNALSGNHTLGFFLYHVTENGHFKNPPPRSQDHPPVRFHPMGLQLYYQLTAHSDLAAEASSTQVQRLFGLAVKALHDFPSIDASTRFSNGTPVFPSGLQGSDNCFRIGIQPVPPAEAPQFWTAGNQNVRLAAYYEVSVVLLEPEPPSRFAGRVLRYGVHTFVQGAPRLDGSRSTVVFRVPGETADRQVEVETAEAARNGRITFHGTDLAGDQTTLLLGSPRFPQPVEVGLDWGVTATQDRIFATVQAQAGTAAALPGIYSAVAKVARGRKMPDGAVRVFNQTSNAVPFLITPTITNLAPLAGTPTVITITGEFFLHADLQFDSVKLTVGAQEVPREPLPTLPPPLPSAGHFRVEDATTIVLRFPIAGLNTGEVLPLRLRINGVENAPRWLQVP